MTNERVLEILAATKSLAVEYKSLTGKPLGVTGEIAEYEAARILGLELADARTPGYDAVRHDEAGIVRVQIKGRCVREGGQGRLGKIDLRHEWDVVLLVLLNDEMEATSMWEAGRAEVVAALSRPGSISRNERGQLALNQFRRISQTVWMRDEP